ncbi:MAG: hypothetical protein EOP04_30195 [Proteobacteria bacterium]|nr:MAG: hypothetical protein EOP04_30195 [Pseudomonadota bacterium]
MRNKCSSAFQSLEFPQHQISHQNFTVITSLNPASLMCDETFESLLSIITRSSTSGDQEQWQTFKPALQNENDIFQPEPINVAEDNPIEL